MTAGQYQEQNGYRYSSFKYFQSQQEKVGSTHTNQPKDLLLNLEKSNIVEIDKGRKMIFEGKSMKWNKLSVGFRESLINGTISYKNGNKKRKRKSVKTE